MKLFLGLSLLMTLSLPVLAADLLLLNKGTSEYQIVLPDKAPTPALQECLSQSARLVQLAFKACGAEVPVVVESKRDAARPGLYLGATSFARQHALDTTRLADWSYVLQAAGKDVIIAGNDQPSPLQVEKADRRHQAWDRNGTAKAVADFARQYLGVRFLYPEVPSYSTVAAAAKVDLLASPAVEFLPLASISVPADLKVRKTPLLRINTAHPAGQGFYDLAHNRFPRVDEMFGSHTWERAIPPEQHAQAHPEYFALINGQRLKPEGGKAQYCLSNPEVRELIYKDLASRLDQGYASVDLGQPDGFRECQCESCARLFDTGNDWSEKIWIFNRSVAERLMKSHPGKHVSMMSYILTAVPPKTFKAFPANTRIMLTGTNQDDIEPWRAYVVPGGFTGYVYNWCPNLGTRYTPMRTPGFVEAQVKRLAANRIQSLYRDGPGQLFGLEGPVYYVMGRMFDDPEHNSARELLPEFYEAAFGRAAPAMRSFYDQLYHGIELYSDHIGTRCDAWSYTPVEGRKRKTVTDPFQLLAFLYPPRLIAALNADLAQAESLAGNERVKLRLALVRTEFEYLRNLTRVVHLYHAFELQPDQSSRDRLLDAIDVRNASINALYGTRNNPKPVPGWAQVMFPFIGHYPSHLRLEQDGYQEPYANTCLNWDTKAMRRAPLPGRKRLSVPAVAVAPWLDDPAWQKVPAHQLGIIPPLSKLPRETSLRLLHDQTNLYIRVESELEPDGPAKFSAQKRDGDLRTREALDVYLAPQPGREVFYRFMAGANPEARYDAVSGFITDAMDPRYGKDDPTWNGAWQSEGRIDAETHRWHALLTIPFQTLAVAAPAAGTIWQGNFARYHALTREKMDRSIWSSSLGGTSMEDRSLFGEIIFE